MSGCGGAVCTGWGPIKPSRKDVLTDGTKRQILAHDEYGESLHCPAFMARR